MEIENSDQYDSVDICVCCGKPVLEGRMICTICEADQPKEILKLQQRMMDLSMKEKEELPAAQPELPTDPSPPPKAVRKPWRKILRWVSNILIALVVLLAVLLHGLKLLGLHPYTVMSGSMESVYPTGSMIYVAKTDPNGLKVGDAITFYLPNGVVATHRIVELVPDEDKPSVIRFRTKGDENKVTDGALVSKESVIGEPVFCIPYLGYLAVWIGQAPGKYVAMAVALLLVLLELLMSVFLDGKPSANIEKPTKKENSDEKV